MYTIKSRPFSRLLAAGLFVITAQHTAPAADPFDYFRNNWNVVGLKDHTHGRGPVRGIRSAGSLEPTGRVEPDERHYGFTVKTSLDGKAWDRVANRRDNKDRSTRKGHTCTFTPRQARYIRVTQTYNSANTGRHLVEVMAYRE